jgi:Mg2+-importing ATPase
MRTIIKMLRSRGHVVGFMGDGINDAAALREADIGISVDTAVDIAKESVDIVLLEKSLLVLNAGVMEGRRTFGNIAKYIKMGTSSAFGNMFSLLGASIFLPFLPMLPVQILLNNLLYDFSQTGIPFDRVDADYLGVPRKWRINDIRSFMVPDQQQNSADRSRRSGRGLLPMQAMSRRCSKPFRLKRRLKR